MEQNRDESMADGNIFVGDTVVRDITIGSNSTIISNLLKTAPDDVQKIVTSQIGLLDNYHRIVLDQAKRSFFWAIIAAAVGLFFFLAAVIFVLVFKTESASIISLISGALIEVISGINFYLYNKTSAQLADFQMRLDKTQGFMLANSICEGLDSEHKQTARLELIRAISGYIPHAFEQPKS
jgi:TRADD-N domain-containing protein